MPIESTMSMENAEQATAAALASKQQSPSPSSLYDANASLQVKREYAMSKQTLLTQEEIQIKTARIAERIAHDYASFNLSIENPLVLVCVLKGAFIFAADLCRCLADYNVPVRMEFICVTSYGANVTSSGQVRLLLDVRESVEARHVLIVEDIVDSAVTLKYLHELFMAKAPASLKTVVLLDKPLGRKVHFSVDYVVESVPNAFVIGYGLDYAEAYRELRDVCVLKPEYYENKESKLEAQVIIEWRDELYFTP